MGAPNTVDYMSDTNHNYRLPKDHTDALIEKLKEPQSINGFPKSITFDPVAQSNLPQWVKDKMKANQNKLKL